MPTTTTDLFRSYVRSLRVQVPFTLVAVGALWALDVNGLRSYGRGSLLLVGAGLLFVLSPLLWLRYEAVGRRDKRLAVLLVLSIVWMVVSTVIVLGVVALVLGD